MDKNKHTDNLSLKYLNGCLVLLLYYNLQGCCQSAMVARAMSLFRQEKDKGSCCPPAPPAAWGPSEDYRSITSTFQYLETSGISIKPLPGENENSCSSYWRPHFPPVCRLVLGSHFCEWCSGSSPEKIWGDVPHEGQQSSQTHADPVSEDVLRPHQRAYWVQQGLLLAGLHCCRATAHADLPRHRQPRATLHDIGPRATEPHTQRHVPKGEVWPVWGRGSGMRRAPEADVPPAQTGGVPLFKAPDAPHHQQTCQLPRPAAAPKAPAVLPAGLPVSYMRVSVSMGLTRHDHCQRTSRVFIHFAARSVCDLCDQLFTIQLLNSLIVVECNVCL